MNRHAANCRVLVSTAWLWRDKAMIELRDCVVPADGRRQPSHIDQASHIDERCQRWRDSSITRHAFTPRPAIVQVIMARTLKLQRSSAASAPTGSNIRRVAMTGGCKWPR
jgi:hypothetical protein